MNKEIGQLVQKRYHESRQIILGSKNKDDCAEKLIKWFGGTDPQIERIVYDIWIKYDDIKKNLTKQRNK